MEYVEHRISDITKQINLFRPLGVNGEKE